MRKYKAKDPIPTSLAIFLIVAGLIVGTIFTVGMHYWNAPIERDDAICIEVTFESYHERKALKNNHSKGIDIYFSDYDQQHIDVSCLTNELRNDLEHLSKGDKITILVHPNSSTIWEICSNEKTILSFEYVQEKLRGDNIGFGILGIFMYFCAVLGISSLLTRYLNARNRKRK